MAFAKSTVLVILALFMIQATISSVASTTKENKTEIIDPTVKADHRLIATFETSDAPAPFPFEHLIIVLVIIAFLAFMYGTTLQICVFAILIILLAIAGFSSC
ncbi:hypothetical protein RIF29_17259 [Crotalaria pallida]|uniref:Transmembrane protein n=1 Tax=Crotalaria pallida TaxID=3830 RepID=A0AAN9FIY2_CROPI